MIHAGTHASGPTPGAVLRQRAVLAAAVVLGAVLMACPSSEPAATDGSGEPAVPAEASGAEPSSAAPETQTATTPGVPGAPGGPAAPAGSAAPEGSAAPTAPLTGPDAVCPFVEADVPAGAVACPEGCVMVRAAPVDETLGCARAGATFEVAIACLELPAEIQPGGACYRNEQGDSVVTAFNYPAILHAGWTSCPDDYAFRQVAPCPMGAGSADDPIPAPEGSAGPP